MACKSEIVDSKKKQVNTVSFKDDFNALKTLANNNTESVKIGTLKRGAFKIRAEIPVKSSKPVYITDVVQKIKTNTGFSTLKFGEISIKDIKLNKQNGKKTGTITVTVKTGTGVTPKNIIQTASAVSQGKIAEAITFNFVKRFINSRPFLTISAITGILVFLITVFKK